MTKQNELLERMAEEIWHYAQGNCEYTVDPTHDECRGLAQAALDAIKPEVRELVKAINSIEIDTHGDIKFDPVVLEYVFDQIQNLPEEWR